MRATTGPPGVRHDSNSGRQLGPSARGRAQKGGGIKLILKLFPFAKLEESVSELRLTVGTRERGFGWLAGGGFWIGSEGILRLILADFD